MGIYLNPGNDLFYSTVTYSEIYVDKTMLISFTNKCLFGENKEICVSRPRRFGKSMAENMLTAYYSKGCDSRELFSKFQIAQTPDFEKHLNRYNVIHIDMQCRSITFMEHISLCRKQRKNNWTCCLLRSERSWSSIFFRQG
jgi:hypothetical protein